jgi:RNA recognition motif-containing protein
MPDMNTGKARIKIYADPNTGRPKGDALITYFKPESVDLAVQLLDDGDFRPSCRVGVKKVTIPLDRRWFIERRTFQVPKTSRSR